MGLALGQRGGHHCTPHWMPREMRQFTAPKPRSQQKSRVKMDISLSCALEPHRNLAWVLSCWVFFIQSHSCRIPEGLRLERTSGSHWKRPLKSLAPAPD